jgi:NADPH:quinone reductase-like Zn-dependent oxidoreductase
MRQAVIADAFGIENVKVVDRPEPVPGPGEVLVRIRACSLNYRDYLVATGKYSPKLPMPRVLLSDGAGEVVSDGKRWKRGDRVAGIFMQRWLTGPYREGLADSSLGAQQEGVLSEYVTLDEDGLVTIPSHLSFEEAATLPCAAVTAWNALFESGRVRPGHAVLVQGSGGVSVFALQFAKAAGARVIATSSSAEKRERLSAMGADWVLDYKTDPEWGKAIARAGGVDHVVEVGGVGTLGQALTAVKAGGHVSVIGILTGRLGEINIGQILHKHLTVQGIYVGSREMFERMNTAITQNALRPAIDSRFDISQIQEALRYMESAAHFGKIVVTT